MSASRHTFDRDEWEERTRAERELQAAKEAAEEAERRSAFLAEAGALLSASLDYEATLANLAQLAVPHFADYCTIFEVEGEGRIRQVASAHVDAGKEPLLRRLGDLYFSVPDHPQSAIARVVRTGEPLLIDKMSYSQAFALARHEELLDIYRRLDRESSMILPLAARGQTLGVLFLATSESRRRYGQSDLRLGEELARRAALAIDNARLYRAAQAANEAKDQFLAALSHELRTPLTPVLAVVAGLQETEPHLQRELAMIRRNVELEARLIDDLLDLTRVSRGKLELRREVTDLLQVIEHALESCASDLAAAGLRAEADFEPADHRLWADAPRLLQVFWNLLRNAIKFTPAGGALAVRSRREERPGPEDGPPQGWLVVEVSDTGIGIDRDVLPRIFDAFEQGRASIPRRFGGLGLGLAISRAIVELHGGSLTAESQGRDHGATFTVCLPLGEWLPETAELSKGPERSAPAPDLPSEEPPNERARLLLVEDHADTAEAMAELLRAFGYRVTVEASVAAGLSAADAGDTSGFDLLVSDIGLPDGSGHELMRELAERHGLRGIALSGYGTDDDLRKSREAGFVRHLTKPVTPRALEAAIREALGTAPE